MNPTVLLALSLIIQQHDVGSHTASNPSTALVSRADWNASGFVSASDVSITFDNATRTLTVSPAGASFDYYINGDKYTSTGVSVVIPDVEGTVAAYMATTEVITIASGLGIQGAVDAVKENCFIGFFNWDATNDLVLLAPAPYIYAMSPDSKGWIYRTHDGIWESGMALGDLLTDQDGSLDTHAQFSVGIGTMTNGSLVHNFSAVGATTGLLVLYAGAGPVLRWSTNSGYAVLTTGTGRLAYNSAGAQVEATSGRFVLAHVMATNAYQATDSGPIYIAWQGQAEYTTLGQAEAGAVTEKEFLLGPIRAQKQPKLVLVATVIYQTSDAYSNAVKARIRQTSAGADFIDWLP